MLADDVEVAVTSAITAHASLDEVLDRLTAEHTRDAELVLAARKEYEERRGRVHEDEQLWDAWSAAFVEWFLVERVAELRAYLTSHRSLFEVRALGDGRVQLLDLIGGATFSVAEPRTLHGVEVGDVAELRVIGWSGDVLFGRTFVYHPPAARAAIAGHVAALEARGMDRRAIVDHVASLRIKVDRYRHVAPAKVYELGREKLAD